MQAGLLREQIVLRDFNQAHRSCVAALCKKRLWIGVERDLRCNCDCWLSRLFFVRSTTLFLAHTIVCDRVTAVGGPLHVSHLIQRL